MPQPIYSPFPSPPVLKQWKRKREVDQPGLPDRPTPPWLRSAEVPLASIDLLGRGRRLAGEATTFFSLKIERGGKLAGVSPSNHHLLKRGRRRRPKRRGAPNWSTSFPTSLLH
ncbi:hypothetical protein CRG98_011176 [Punica granatum]|uniref:Uncharacterized protein n=1 Tax=Punica granatum TaxID=22663 RepID=A0A2I0KIT8_PUNGR|nr:hypothetical protein CRG98_011176 [Punica granatum]